MLSRVVYDNIRVGLSILHLILPHWDSMRRTRLKIRKLLDIHIIEHETVFNNTCFSLSLKDIVAHELANPYVVEHLEFYPHETNGKNIRALYHSAKWREHLGREYRVQMVPAGGKHYYIYEPVTLRNGRIVVPIYFYKHETGLRSKCVIPKFSKATNHNNSASSQQSQASIEFDFYIRSNIQYDSPDVLDIEVSQFDKIYSEIVRPDGYLMMAKCGWQIKEIGASRSSDPIVVPNPWRIRAKNKIIRHVPLTLYADDTSGNKSKRWNKHISFYLTLSGLPPEMTNMEYNCHFVTTSNVASPLELAEPVVSQLNQLSTEGAFAFDATLKEEVMFMCIPLAFLADSPMAAKFTNTPNPGKANNPCRMCHLQTDTVENRCTLEFIKAFFGQPQMPPPRQWHQTISRSHELWHISQRDTQKEFKTKSMKYGLKDQITHRLLELQAQKVHERVRINQLEQNARPRLFSPVLELKAFDGCNDTPVEILHVILLGVVKYVFNDFMNGLNKTNYNKLEACLRSFNTDSLNIPHIQASYMMAHYKSFVGKDYRTILQLAPFVLFQFMNESQKELWVSMCHMTSLAFQTRIPDLEPYLQELEAAIREFIFHISKMSARWSNKPKLHMLLHLPQSIRRFGPASLFATEKFESYNSILRTASIHSNRLAPSRDLAISFANYQIMRLLSSDVYMYDPDRNEYFQARSKVSEIFANNVIVQKQLGYNLSSIHPTRTYPCLKDPKVQPTDKEEIPQLLKEYHPNRRIRQVSQVRINSKETIKKGTFYLEAGTETYADRICCVESLWEVHPGAYYVRRVGCAIYGIDPVTRMAILQKIGTSIVVSVQHIKACVNVQHNCHEGQCQHVEAPMKVNPRHEGSSIFHHIQHTNHNSYLLNAFSHHAPEYHRQYSGLRPSVISHHQMMEALHQGLQRWQYEKFDDDLSE
ncbi:hypothetical protein PGT21_022018 [Puccinia graminis f. sp. tritici]|uniref:Uncharacterized protein n=2 Tax=Puccinia graminis f. sp. tritici TaxID=56615 RepID=A0A5B0N168_PUCGR|nr:hypothetical protein PGT21_022018 [Puccinia graminis f. sp. tritici]KAA1124083.1 hypothetical protein PGTUg99_026283 [Puccinia graminis f. sp. tritici]